MVLEELKVFKIFITKFFTQCEMRSEPAVQILEKGISSNGYIAEQETFENWAESVSTGVDIVINPVGCLR